MKSYKHVLVVLSAGVLLCPSASAYYHFLRYLNRTGPYVPVPAKYDLNLLPNKTLNYYISEQGPVSLAANDTQQGVLSQIRLAAKVWNDVDSSDLRLSFGGITAAGTGPAFTGQTAVSVPSGPAIDVIFTDDLAPGLIALGGTSSVGGVSGSGSGAFVPINRSVVMLNKNISDRPSFSEPFFLTLVHEMGHALGLQHTLTSSVMSTEITRATTKAKPLAADDIAGISILYPARNFLAATGSVRGRVTMSGDGVSLASVVAIPQTGAAISTLTNPDGTYRIDGIPPGQYVVYVHPLPPPIGGVEVSPANIKAPIGPDDKPFLFGSTFDTIFFRGAKDPNQTPAISVTAGSLSDNIDFSVQRRTASAISAVQSYGFIGQVTIKPPTINRNDSTGKVVFAGQGLLAGNGSIVAGLAARPFQPAVSLASALKLYPDAASYVELDVNVSPTAPEGSHHLLLSASNDIYVLPSAFQISTKPPPSVLGVNNTVDPNGTRVVAITGTGFDRDTRFLFDGYPAAVRSLDDTADRALVTPPPATSGYRASVVALNADGQSSLFVQGNNVAFYTYDVGDAPAFTITPSSLSAGSEAMVDLTGTGLNLIDGLAKLGLGTSDVAVRRVWVLNANHLVANVGVSGNAAVANNTVAVANGLETISMPGGLSVLPANSRQMQVFPQAINPVTGQALLNAGGLAMVLVQNLPAGIGPGGITMTLNDQPVSVLGVSAGQVSFQIPAATPSGAAILRLRTATDTALPIALNIEPPPPSVSGIQSAGLALDATRSVAKGDTVTTLVSGLVFDAYTGQVNAAGVTLTVAGLDQPVLQINPSSALRGVFEVSFNLGNTVPSGTLPLVVTQDGRSSAPSPLQVR